jgi:CrcB protein
VLNQLLAVATGGALGSTARYLVSDWAQKAFGPDFPWGTALVNIAGCFLIGFLMTLATELPLLRPEVRLLLVTGFLGGLTTFSTFSYETVRLAQTGAPLAALLNAGVNLLVGLPAVLLGAWLARRLG